MRTDALLAPLRTLAPQVQWALLAGGALLAIALPYLLPSFYVGIVTQILFFGLFAMSIDLLGGYTGLMPLGHAGLMGVSGYSLGYLISRLKWSWPEAVVVALLLTLLVSLVFGLLAVRTSGIFFVMITMAEGMLVWGLAYRWSAVTGADNGMRGIARPDFAVLYWQYYYLVLAVFAVCALLLVLIVRSPFGLTLKGIRESASRMRTLGYNVTLHKLIAFLLSGFFAGVAGVLLAWYSQFISPSSIYIVASTEGILMVVLGGIGTLLGPVLGTIVIVLIKSLLSTYVARWPLVMGLIFIVVVLFARNGLLGALRRGWARLGSGRPDGRQPAAAVLGATPPRPAGEEEGVTARS
jgi:branched-chain amino acid transport system permease protein